MKNIIIGLCVYMFVGLVVYFAYSGEIVWENHADVSISTSAATLVHGMTYGRKEWTITNTSNYKILITTMPNTSTTTGAPLWYGGHIEDDFCVINSSVWAICAGSNAGTLNFSEKW